MPATGRLRASRNPYNPAEELCRSARYLDVPARQVRQSRPRRRRLQWRRERASARFIAGTGYSPSRRSTMSQIITGAPVTDWLAGDVTPSDYALQTGQAVRATPASRWPRTASVKQLHPADRDRPALGHPARAVLLVGHRPARLRRACRAGSAVLGDEELMLVAKRNPNFGRALRFTAEIGRDSRAEAQKLCAALQQGRRRLHRGAELAADSASQQRAPAVSASPTQWLALNRASALPRLFGSSVTTCQPSRHAGTISSEHEDADRRPPSPPATSQQHHRAGIEQRRPPACTFSPNSRAVDLIPISASSSTSCSA